MRQLITPTPNIPCKPGWCLQYVRQAFGLPARHPTATAAWEASTSKHRDRNFPKAVWLPVWFSLSNEPAGHVALMAPDGSVYSTSDLGSVPHHHLDLSDLMNYYARYGMTLKYLGWTEDVAGYPVLAAEGIAAQGTITPLPEEDDMPTLDEIWNHPIEDPNQPGRTYPASEWLAMGNIKAGRAEAAALGVDEEILYGHRDEEGRNLVDRQKQTLWNSLSGKPGESVNVPELAKALSEQLAGADAEALVDALAKRLGK